MTRLYTADKAALILNIPPSAIMRYVWVYKFIKPVQIRPWRFDFNQLVALRRIRDLLVCGIPHAKIHECLMLPEISISAHSCQVTNSKRQAEEKVESALRRYRRLMA